MSLIQAGPTKEDLAAARELGVEPQYEVQKQSWDGAGSGWRDTGRPEPITILSYQPDGLVVIREDGTGIVDRLAYGPQSVGSGYNRDRVIVRRVLKPVCCPLPVGHG